MRETTIEVADLREGDTFEWYGGKFSVKRIWGGGEMRTIHLEAWRQGEGAELKISSTRTVQLVCRMSDLLLRHVQDERAAAALASFDALVRELEEAPDAPAEPVGEDVQTCEACVEPESPLYDVDGAMICGACAAGALEHERHTRHAEQADTLHHFTEQLRAYAAERDEARTALDAANRALADATDNLTDAQDEIDTLRADLARYAAVYGDPDAPVDAAHLFTLEKPSAPLFPGLAAMADRLLRGTPISPTAIADAPHIKVGDRVRCESLGNLTGIVETVNPSDVPGWDQCLVRDDREGHVWGAVAWILEVLP